jgi:hypothetical protein
MREALRVLLPVLVFVVMPLAAGAQTLGTIAGSAKDASGAVLPGVSVEVSSPALIEKVRSVVTDGSGLYRIVNLPPGVYTVTFTLQGFNAVRREGIEVSPSFTATIDGDMRVGNIQETVTVTGESPVVDVQSAAATRSITAEVFKEIPSSGSWVQMASLVPAIRATVQDVGGVAGDATGASVSAHGARAQDGVSMIDGLRIGNMYLSSNVTNMSLSPLLADQVDIQLSGQMAETGTNGVIMNMVPRAGGNTFRGTALANASSPGLQGSNVTARLQARGLTGASTTLKKLADLNGAVGGPIRRDKVWFYVTSRYFTNEFYLAGNFYPVDPSVVQRQDDTARQAFGGTYTYDNNGRVTVALSDKQKISGWYAFQYKVDPHWVINSTVSPEAARVTTWHTQLSTFKWTYTASERLLFEAGVAAGESPDTILAETSRIGACPSQGSLAPRCISIVEQGGVIARPLTYRAPTNFDFDDRLPSQSYNVSASYITGSHQAKLGVELQRGHFWRGDNNESTGGIFYRTRDFSPNLVTINAPLSGWQDNLNYNLGFFAQDRWTVNRLTLSGGVRVDLLNESTEAFTAQPHRWLPNRNFSFAAVKNVPNWKDVNPRVSAAYDLFGNGRTAVKASASRGVEQDSIRYARANNPATTVQTSTARVWTDSDLDFFPDCDLFNPAINGECLAWQTPAFGTAVPGTRYDRAIMEGWGERPWNWEFSTGIQHELMPRLSVAVAYFRRIEGNFQVTDNEALSAADYTRYSVVAPANLQGVPPLPTAGQTIAGFYDVNRIVAASNVVTDASNFGKQQAHWNGFDVTLDARLRNGLFLQGGVSTGKTMTDNCEIVDDLPESLGVQSAEYCHQVTPFLAQYKALASYTLPYAIRISGTFQSLPGPEVTASNVYTNAALATTTLGRPFTLNQATVNVIKPATLFGDRLNQFDLRFTKVIPAGRGNIDLNVDLYNAFNSDAVITQQNAYGTAWQRPLSVIQPRFAKFYVRWDF